MQCKFVRQFGYCPSSDQCELVGTHPPLCEVGNSCMSHDCALLHSEPICSSANSCPIYGCPRRHGPSRLTCVASRGLTRRWEAASHFCLGEEEGSMTDAESDSMIGNSSAGGEMWVGGVERRSPPKLQDLMCLSPSKKNAKRRRGTETVGVQEESVKKSPRLPENELEIEEDDDDGNGGVNL